ncbi:MAG: ABC transporter [Calditrichaeota bacterium]|nr:MAG: ABC transporter [Calditrichota bacterium]
MKGIVLSLRNIFAVFEKELKSYFVSPIAYVVIALFLGITGIFFYIYVARFAQLSAIPPQQAFQFGIPQNLNINLMVIRFLLQNMSLFALFWLPLITMRLYSEEKKTGTIELLLTSPITNLQIVLGKFAAAVTIYLIMLALTFFYHSFLFMYGNPELKPILVGYLGLFLLGSTYIAYGILFSSTTENQIVAAVETFAFILLFWVIGWISEYFGPTLGNFLSNFSIIDHFDDFSKGVLDTKNVIFYLSFIVMGIYLTYVQVESTRWRGSQ